MSQQEEKTESSTGQSLVRARNVLSLALDDEDRELLEHDSEDLKLIKELSEKIAALGIPENKLSISPKVIQKIQRFRKLSQLAPQQVERAIASGDYQSLVSIGNTLGYTGNTRSEYVKVFLAKILSHLSPHSKEAQRLLSKFKSVQQADGADLHMIVNITVLRLWLKEISRIANDKENRMLVLETAVSKGVLRKYRTQLPYVPSLKIEELAGGEKLFTINEDKSKRLTTWHKRSLDTITNEIANPTFEVPVPNPELLPSMLRLRTEVAHVVATHYYGTGTESGQVKRMMTVYEMYEWSQMQKRESREIYEQKGDEDYEYIFTDNYFLFFQYMKLIGVYEYPEWAGRLPSNPLEWVAFFDREGLRLNPVNVRSDAGAPFNGAKKGQCYTQAMIREAQTYEYAQVMGRKALKSVRPEIGVIDLKPKGELYELETPFPLTASASDLDKNAWIKSNINQKKVRTIHNPPMGTILAQMLFNAAFKNTSSWHTLDELKEALETQEIFSLKNFPYTMGTFDALIRRIFGLAPFKDTPHYLKMVYSDNGYMVIKAKGWRVDPNVVTIVPTHSRYKKWDKRVAEAKKNKSLVEVSDEHVFVSIDGSKMESATDTKDVDEFLKNFCKYLHLPAHAVNYLGKVTKFAIAGGKGVLGDKAFLMPYQASGNPITFQLNDIKIFGIMQLINENMTFEEIYEVARRLGVKLTLERVVIMERGVPPVLGEQELHIDLLGFGAACFDRVAPDGLYVPVLERQRRVKSLVANKRGDRLTPQGEVAKLISLYIYGGWIDPAYTFVLKFRLKQLIDQGVGALDETVIEDLPPLSQRIVSEINDLGIGNITETTIANIFGTKYILPGSVVHTAPQPKFYKEWGLLSTWDVAEDPLRHRLFEDKYRHVLDLLISRYLDDTGAKIPVAKTQWSGGRVKSFELDKSNEKFWKTLRTKLGLSDKKASLVRKVVREFLVKYPHYSSRYEQDLNEAVRIEEERNARIQQERAQRKLEQKARKQHAIRKQKEKEPQGSKQAKVLKTKDGVELFARTDDDLLVDGKVPYLDEKSYINQLKGLLDKAPRLKGQYNPTEFGNKLVKYITDRIKKKTVLSNLSLLAVQEPPSDFTWSEIKSNSFDIQIRGEISGVRRARQWFRQALIVAAFKNSSLFIQHNGEMFAQGHRVFTVKLLKMWVQNES